MQNGDDSENLFGHCLGKPFRWRHVYEGDRDQTDPCSLSRWESSLVSCSGRLRILHPIDGRTNGDPYQTKYKCQGIDPF
jgi:hypothetical protein